MNVIVVGPAGSGKSTFVKNFSKYLKDYDVKVVNLDPASDPIYKADRDIREFVRTEDVMKNFGLGINGALLKSIELSLERIDDLILDGDYVIYDTPGQMELFLYSKHGLAMAEKIARGWSVCVFIIDAEVASTPENFASIVAQNAVISLRLSMPTVTIINKCDLVDFDLDELITSKLKDVEGVLGEIVEKLMGLIDYTTMRFRIIKVSALSGLGFENVLSALNEVFCSCGDIS
ncbi:PRK13768 family protein [Archaeoglobus sp.]